MDDALSAAHGSEKRSLASVSETELGVSTAEVSSVLSSPSWMSSSLKNEDRDRALPRVELEHEVCLLRVGLYSSDSPCSVTHSGRRGDVGRDPLLAKADGGIRSRNAWREGEEWGMSAWSDRGVLAGMMGDVEDRLDLLCP